MTIDATDNLPLGGTDSAQPSSNDNLDGNWDYYDPDEDQDNAAQVATAKTEGEPDENAEGVQESEGQEQQEPETEEVETAETQAKPATSKVAEDDAIVTLKDGRQVPVSELRNGYMRQDHFTRERQKEVQRAAHVQRTAQQIEEFVRSQVPPPPEYHLANTDPQRYFDQVAKHDASRRLWEDILAVREQADTAVNQFTAEQHQEVLNTENALLIEKLPALADKKARTEFMDKALNVARLAGVSEEEFRTFTDHRYFAVLDLAIEGMEARKSKQIAKQKVAAAPPVAPVKRQAPTNSVAVKNRDAMSRLSRTGSIRDALNVDFD